MAAFQGIGSSGLAGNHHSFVLHPLAGGASAAPHHLAQTLAQFGGVLRRADAVANVGHGHDGVGLPFARVFLHQVRTHKLAVVGNGVVDGECAQRRDFGGVAECHARERDAAAVVVLEFRESGNHFTPDTRVELVEESHLLQTLAESVRVLAIFRDDDFRHANVRRALDDFLGREGGAAVVVLDGAVAVVPHRAGCPLLVDALHNAVFQRHQHRDGFHHRARLVARHSIVAAFNIVGPFLVFLQVRYGLDFAGCHLHEHGGAPLGLALHEHAVEFVLHDVLQLNVDGGGDVIAFHGRHIFPVHDAVGELDALGLPGHAVERRVECHFQARASVNAFACLVLTGAADAS